MSEKRTVRIGLATLAFAAGLAVVAGPATAEVPLTPAADIAVDDSQATPTPLGILLYNGSSALKSGSAALLPKPSTDPCHGLCG
ncbi:hypothetical protein ACWCW7_20235 [Nocardia tengchongensis]